VDLIGASKIHIFRAGSLGGTQVWTVDEDCILVAVASTGAFLLSDDPSQSAANWNSPTNPGQQNDGFYLTSGSAGIQLTQLAFELQAGTQVYCNMTSAGSVTLLTIK
jgi:hypothetical protein